MQDLNPRSLPAALTLLGQRLGDLGVRVDLVVIGGGALLLAGLATRSTKDVDIVALKEGEQLTSAEALPESFFEAAREVAREFGFRADWINTGPKELLRFGLPTGFLSRCARKEFGPLGLYVASRLDQIHLKLYAATDQGPKSRHFDDLLSLSPTTEELSSAGRWCRTHDPSPAFCGILLQAMRHAGWEGRDEELD